MMKQLKKEGIAIILISHDLHDVFSLSDRIAVMKNGVLQIDWQSVCPGNATRFPLVYEIDLATAPADVWRVDVQSSVARSMYGAWNFVAEAR